MRATRPALRVALLGLGAVLLGLAVIGGYLGILDLRYHAARHRATAAADGLVVQDEIGDGGDIRVRWADQQERVHTQRFAVYDTDLYRKGSTFGVAYDPRHPDARAFPTDPDETSATDDFEVPIGLAGIGAVVLVLWWAGRGLLFRRQRALGTTPAEADLFSSTPLSAGLVIGRSLWVQLDRRSWQRVMWHPALTAFTAGPVLVHGDPAGRRRVVVELADGTLLVPAGRLRRKRPGRVQLDPHDSTRVDADELWLFPPGTPVPAGSRWWRAPLTVAAAGAGLGSLMSFLLGAPLFLPAFAAAVSALLVNGWALIAPEP